MQHCTSTIFQENFLKNHSSVMIQRLKGGGPAPPSSDQTLSLTADSGSASPTLLGDELGCLLTTAGARPPLTGGEHLQGCWLPFQRQTVRLTGPRRDKTGVASPPSSSGVNRPRKPAARLVLRVPLHRWVFFPSLLYSLFLLRTCCPAVSLLMF